MIVTDLFCLAAAFALISANELWHQWRAWRTSRSARKRPAPATQAHAIAETDLHDRAKVLR